MKPNITPREKEITMGDDEFIVSKTDTSGRITYANRVFMRIADYSERELIGVQHNIIRHPDMPRGAFKFMWDTIKRGEEFFAYVKNLRSDGAYYWVFANITPDFGPDGTIQGFYSVRRKPKQSAIDTLVPVYRQMLEVERKAGPKDACAASIAFLSDILAGNRTTYEQFILSL